MGLLMTLDTSVTNALANSGRLRGLNIGNGKDAVVIKDKTYRA
jgi:hypothetical protein